ncbi:xylose isomerase [Rathayibacter sp. AY1E9]|jgi:sugar phosphate isomerase/epimerase|uniref:metabolite traffic protein EboE n=1 Tax=unclassified Rathayibacter TaxID=2609250 RepID=UPI000CE7D9B9|nr:MULTISPECIES: metabolite traffic protein EboE [unclassified Rathayibacter]PPF10249.1 xylose isomerase [Rathayibacter sp. AY1A5]PPF18943.1 xylose isomerase [Rathayibacter sp. AY1A4]PPF34210.1 xylose isomerase [Rathayibacter sp. AY1A2]PPF50447.1 xylose isomerase [Rathayibacter sp. AY1A1]PPG10300.1 xylose isomerase [Rathayibacter sp. AY2B1]
MHLSYCTNVHPAEDLAGVVRQLDVYAGPARVAAGLALVGVGLWIPRDLAARLVASAEDRAVLRAALQRNGLEVRTLNAFPYAAFHAEVVKLDVYRPDWTTPERLQYTIDCARILADLLPAGADGSISTLPLGWREGWGREQDEAACRNLARLVEELRDLRRSTGHAIRLAIEPEPGCILDTVDDVVDWLHPRIGVVDPAYVGVCLDTCHLAVSFADPVSAVRRIRDAGLRVVKVQASAALHLEDPSGRAALTPFVEKRYLHQTRENGIDGVLRVDDLPEALDTLPGTGPWRVHFHVPLHHRPEAPLSATTAVLAEAVSAVDAAWPYDEIHLDVETYTWSVLADAPSDLSTGIGAELAWAAAHLLTPASREALLAPLLPQAAAL